MFTGIVTDIGELLTATQYGDLRRLRIGCAYDADTIAIGASIACAGICLTVVAVARADGRAIFDVDAGAETLKLTSAGGWLPGARINLERALRIGDELGGHIVTGHVDGPSVIVSRDDFEGMARFTIDAPHSLAGFIAKKGSIALDGVSLTVNEVADNRFSVLLIPHTLAVTTFGARKPGDALNLEVDMMARYAARLIEIR
jgi:riboflavin synthase